MKIWTANDTHVAFCEDNMLQVRDVKTFDLVYTNIHQQVECLLFCSNGDLLCWLGDRLQCWNKQTRWVNKKIQQMPYHYFPRLQECDTCYMINVDDYLFAVDKGSGHILFEKEYKYLMDYVVLSAGDYLVVDHNLPVYMTGRGRHKLTFISREMESDIMLETTQDVMTLSVCQQKLLVPCYHYYILLSVPDLKEILRISNGIRIKCLYQFSPNGHLIAFMDLHNCDVQIYSATTGCCLSQVQQAFVPQKKVKMREKIVARSTSTIRVYDPTFTKIYRERWTTIHLFQQDKLASLFSGIAGSFGWAQRFVSPRMFY